MIESLQVGKMEGTFIHFGPFKYLGSGNINRTISSPLIEEDSDFNLVVILNTSIIGTIESDEHFFGERFECNCNNTCHYTIPFLQHVSSHTVN